MYVCWHAAGLDVDLANLPWDFAEYTGFLSDFVSSPDSLSNIDTEGAPATEGNLPVKRHRNESSSTPPPNTASDPPYSPRSPPLPLLPDFFAVAPPRSHWVCDKNGRKLLQEWQSSANSLLHVLSTPALICDTSCGTCGVCLTKRYNTRRCRVLASWAKAYPRKLWYKVGKQVRLNLSPQAEAGLRARGLPNTVFDSKRACEIALLTALRTSSSGVVNQVILAAVNRSKSGVLTQGDLTEDVALAVLRAWCDLDPASFHIAWVNAKQ